MFSAPIAANITILALSGYHSLPQLIPAGPRLPWAGTQATQLLSGEAWFCVRCSGGQLSASKQSFPSTRSQQGSNTTALFMLRLHGHPPAILAKRLDDWQNAHQLSFPFGQPLRGQRLAQSTGGHGIRFAVCSTRIAVEVFQHGVLLSKFTTVSVAAGKQPRHDMSSGALKRASAIQLCMSSRPSCGYGPWKKGQLSSVSRGKLAVRARKFLQRKPTPLSIFFPPRGAHMLSCRGLCLGAHSRKFLPCLPKQ